jgi:hypothetical protein
VFRRIGCNAQVHYRVHGVRAVHDAHDYATLMRSGIRCTSMIECKFWKTRVTKETVLALKSIIDDLGAIGASIVEDERTHN